MKSRILSLLILASIFLLAGSAMATSDTLTVQTCLYTGITPAYVLASDTVYVANTGKTLIDVKNVNGASRTVTIHSQLTAAEGSAASDAVVTIPATIGHKIIGPLKITSWNNSSGLVRLIFSATIGDSLAAYKIIN